MRNDRPMTVNGRNLSTGWLADIHLAGGDRREPVTTWLAAVSVVRQALDFEMYGSLDAQWRQLVSPHTGADRVPGQWLIPLDIRALEDLAMDGTRWDRQVNIYEDRYVVHVEIQR